MHGSAGLLPGTLEMLILRVLQKDALHGYAIAQPAEGRVATTCCRSARARCIRRFSDSC